MKQVKIEIPGFSLDTKPHSRPAVCVYGAENTGTSRFGCTLPHDDGAIGWLAIDKNSKVTADKYREEWGIPIICNKEPVIGHKDSLKLAVEEDRKKVMGIYTDIFKKTADSLVALADHDSIESIMVDRASQLYDIILFAHFGRKNQIESFQRGAPNQDMIDLINALGNKNLCLACKANDIWKDTGEIDKEGRKKQAPTGQFKPDGFNQIGRFVTAVVELTAKTGKVIGDDDSEKLADKYRIKIRTCKGNVLLEGQDLKDEYGISGEAITWSNLLNVIGVEG